MLWDEIDKTKRFRQAEAQFKKKKKIKPLIYKRKQLDKEDKSILSKELSVKTLF